jgi:electron transfer flavoprotein alpha subunit
MKTLLVAEQRQGKLLDSSYELLSFSSRLGAEAVMFLVGSEASLPKFDGKLYLAEVEAAGEYNPDWHKQLILEAVRRENPDFIVFLHSAYGWDLAPRLAAALQLTQVSEIVDLVDGGYELSCCNAKMRRIVAPKASRAILTLQAGAFGAAAPAGGKPQVERLDGTGLPSRVEFAGYEATQKEGLDLTRAEVIVSAGRGIGKKENLPIIAQLARALGGELGATRPVVDAGWLDHSHQVGTTGQTVHPKLYVACGISGSIQHVAGMKQSDFIVAINKDKDAPIGTIADVFIVADVLQFVPVLTSRLEK